MVGTASAGETIDLDDLLRVLWRRKTTIAASCGLCLALTGVFLGLTPATWRATALIALELSQPRVVDMPAVTPDLGRNAETLSAKGLIAGEVEALRAPALIRRTVASENLSADPDFVEDPDGPVPPEDQAFRAFSKALTVSAMNRAPVLAVTVEARSPETAARLANRHAALYRRGQIAARRAAGERAAAFLRARLEPLKTAALTADRKVAEYRRAHHLGQQGDAPLSSQQRRDLNAALIKARAELAGAEAAWRRIERARKTGALISSPEVLTSPEAVDLRAREAETARMLAGLSARYGERHPRMIAARAQEADIKARLLLEANRIADSLRAARDSARAKAKSIERSLAALEERRGAEELASLDLRRLEKEAGAAQGLFRHFLKRLRETESQEGVERPDSRILSMATPPTEPASPRRALIVAAGAAAGLLLGLALAAIFEKLESRLTGPDVARRRLSIAVGPLFPLRRPQDGPAAQEEAARAIAALTTLARGRRVLAVASAAPGEGKTTLALAIAKAMASLGRRVVLLELDMRKPGLPDDAPNGDFPTIERLLSGEARFPDVRPGLTIVRAGGAGPAAAGLLAGPSLVRLLACARTAADAVVVDTPPLAPVADARLIAPQCDAVLFAVRWRSTDVRVAQQGVEALKSCGAPNPVAILTQVDMTAQASYGYGGGRNAIAAYRGYYDG